MRKAFSFFLIFLFLNLFPLFSETDPVWNSLSSWIVWTFESGPVSFGEYLGLFEPAEVFVHVPYDSVADDGKWIDELFSENKVFLVTASEEYEELSEILDGKEKNEESEISELSNALAEKISESENISERKILDEEKKLAFYSYGNESLSLQKSDNNKILVRFDGKKAFRSFYDDKMNLVKKEKWICNSLSNGKLLESQEFVYSEGSKPVKSFVTSGNEKHELTYDEKGHIIQSLNYQASLLESKTNWKYSEAGKLLEKKSEEYTYNSKKVLVFTSIKKEVYEYKIEDGNPDYYYYENDDLRMQTLYSSAEDYVTTMIFDDNFVVESYYQAFKRKKDLFYVNGRLRRTKVYE